MAVNRGRDSFTLKGRRARAVQHIPDFMDRTLERPRALRVLDTGFTTFFGELPAVIVAIPNYYKNGYWQNDASLHPGLQDLGWMIGWDLAEAGGWFDDHDTYYPGVDSGIDPVSDDHVRLVTWATNRELERETRRSKPAFPIHDLPFHIQRAFAERRRLRYKQWGIGKKEWESNSWNIQDIPEDPDWLPPWLNKS